MSYCILSASLRLELPFQKLFHHTVLTSTRTTNTKLLFCKRILLEMIGQALGPAITSVRASLSGTTVPDRWDCILSSSIRLELPFQRLFHHTVLTSTRTTNTKLLFCKRILLEMIGQALGPAITSVRASLSGTTVPDRWDCILSSSLRLELPFQRLFHHTVPTTRALKISVRAGLSGTTVPDRWV